MPRLIAIVLALVSLVALAHPSEAQPADPDLGAKAVELGREGMSLFQKGEFEEARARFSAAESLSRSPVFRLYIARCLRHTGKLLAARDAYTAIRSEEAAPSDPPSWTQARVDAKGELAALTTVVPAVRVSLRNPENASEKGPTVVRLDKAVIEVDMRVEVDPGNHVVTLAVGDTVRTEHFTIAEGAPELAITIDVGSSELLATITSPTPGPTKKAPQPADVGMPASVYAGAALLGLGGASLVAGVVTGALAVVRTNEIDSFCGSGDTCPRSRRAEVEPLVEEATAFGNASTGTLVAGGVLAATGLVLVLVRPGEEPREARAEVRLEPSLGGLRLSGDF